MFEYFIVVTCEALSLAHGKVTYLPWDKVGDRYPVDTQAIFSCDKGYWRDGCTNATCKTSGNWTQHKPVCNKGE